MSVRDYYVAPPLPPSAYKPSAYARYSSAEVARRSGAIVGPGGRNQISLAWHALDVKNPQAAREALDQARLYIKSA